jgi:hypothetical protein
LGILQSFTLGKKGQTLTQIQQVQV